MAVNQPKQSFIGFLNPSRNYLTLVVGLVALICVILGILVPFSAEYLETAQRWALLLFFMAFSTAGFGTSVWLIIRHFRKLMVVERDHEVPWDLMQPDRQQMKLNYEVGHLAAVMGIPDSQLSDLRSAYIVAEDLALRHIEQESQIPLMRHISLDNAEFDAVLINHDVVKCIEVTFLVTPDIAQEKINHLLKKVDLVKKVLNKVRPNSRLILLLALVTQLDSAGEAKLRETLAKKFSATPVDVDIRLLDFEALQKVFATT